MTLSNVSLVQQRYDQIADGYDDRWGRHVALPQKRLTRDLELAPGERLMDLACGTGRETVDMLTRVAPGEVVAVDCSEGMLRAAARLAAAQGLELALMQCTAEEAVSRADPESFDVVSVRFALAYIEWRPFFVDIQRVLRKGGRLGILSSLAATSLPQAREVITEIVREFGGPPVEPNVPDTADELTDALHGAGLVLRHHWVHPFRLWFDTGTSATRWLRESGYVTHPQLERVPEQILTVILDLFARRLERFREAKGIPLDFELAGVVAARE